MDLILDVNTQIYPVDLGLALSHLLGLLFVRDWWTVVFIILIFNSSAYYFLFDNLFLGVDFMAVLLLAELQFE